MLLVVILISTALIAIMITLLIGKRWTGWPIPSLLVILMIFLSLLGFIFIIQQSEQISEGISRQAWPSVEAEIVESNIIGERAYSPEISCRYVIDDQEYLLRTDLKTPAFGRKKSRQQTSRIIIAEYPVGSKVNVFYNPANPEDSFIRTGPYWNNFLVLATGIIFLCSGLIVISGSLIKLKKG